MVLHYHTLPPRLWRVQWTARTALRVTLLPPRLVFVFEFRLRPTGWPARRSRLLALTSLPANVRASVPGHDRPNLRHLVKLVTYLPRSPMPGTVQESGPGRQLAGRGFVAIFLFTRSVRLPVNAGAVNNMGPRVGACFAPLHACSSS